MRSFCGAFMSFRGSPTWSTFQSGTADVGIDEIDVRIPSVINRIATLIRPPFKTLHVRHFGLSEKVSSKP